MHSTLLKTIGILATYINVLHLMDWLCIKMSIVDDSCKNNVVIAKPLLFFC